MRSISIRVRANNQIALTLGNLRGAGSSKKSNNRTLSPEQILKCQEIQDAIESYRTDRSKSHDETGMYDGNPIDCLNLSTPYLALIDKFQRSKSAIAKPQGATCPVLPRVKRFEAKQGQKLREAGAAMDDLIGDGNAGLCRAILLTIPADYRDAWATIAAYSGHIMNRLNQVLRRHLDAPLWFYVWELQGRGALHLHFCFYAPTVELGEMLGNKMIEVWLKLLDELSVKSGNDLKWSGRYKKDGEKYYVPESKYINSNQQVRMGCSHYFAKYSGKSSGQGGQGLKGFGSPTVAHPRRIWGSSHAIKRRAREMSLNGRIDCRTDDEASSYFEEFRELIKSFKANLRDTFSFDIKRKVEGKEQRWSEDEKREWNYSEMVTVAEGVTEVYYVNKSLFLDKIGRAHV